MPEHIYEKSDLINRLEGIREKTLVEIDNKGIFNHVQQFGQQKGIAGTVIEQCVLGYEPDTKQEPDLIVIDGSKRIKTELKTTGIVIDSVPVDHFIAKEPMSITAVGIYDIAEQEFYSSHFWSKLEHLLLVYYHYTSKNAVSPYEYRFFPVKGFEFHEFTDAEIDTLKQDWEYVRTLAERVVSHHPGPRNRNWKEAVKQEYIEVHGELRPLLSYIDLAPKFPPRFRLRKPFVSSIIKNHFGFQLEQLPGRYTTISDIDKKCHELTEKYSGKTIGELAQEFGFSVVTKHGIDLKAVSERVVISMFGGVSEKLNQVELFSKYGIIAKTIVLTPSGGRTEDMKLYHIDFNEMTREEIFEENGVARPIEFEDSELYSYFADHEFLCIIFEEPDKRIHVDEEGNEIYPPNSLSANIFIGFKRLVFSNEFIDNTVRKLWEDTRTKILNNTLVDVVKTLKDGTVVTIGSGEVSSAPNFMKSRENDVFVRGSGKDSSLRYKTECVNGIRMLPQYVWIKGTAIIDELKEITML